MRKYDRSVFFTLKDIPDGFSLIIFNRWGGKVFETSSPNQEFWNGETNGCENPDGTYFYQLRNENNEYNKTGFIQLIR